MPTGTTTFLRPSDLAEACELKAAHPDATPVAGGTDVMVGLNFGHTSPPALLDLTEVPELARWRRFDDGVELGAGVTYARIIGELAGDLPGLAQAARTVGSPQIRQRGTVGGNLVTASPAGDAVPPLVARDARIRVVSVRGERELGAAEFSVGPGSTRLADDEIVRSVWVPRRAGPEQFAKLGPRNAMVIAVASVFVSLDATRRTVGCAVGSAGPTVVIPARANEYAVAELDWDGGAPLPATVADRFAELVSSSVTPIDDVRASAGYRRHAVRVLARRMLDRVWRQHRTEGGR